MNFSLLYLTFVVTASALAVNGPEEQETRTRTTAAPPTTMTTTALGDDACGIRTADFDWLSGGEEAQIGQYPWIVALRYAARENSSDVRNLCAGSLITRQHVLTAAQCVKDEDTIKVAVVAGEYNTSGDPDCMTTNDVTPICTNAVVVRTESVHTHPQYIRRTMANDIAVVKLEKELPISDTIRTICLPSGDRQLASEDSALIAGWGKWARSPVLLHDSVEVQDFDQCKERYILSKMEIISPQKFCAGKKKRNTCRQEGGNPFMVAYQGQFYVMGVSSYECNPWCVARGFHTSYTNVTNYLDWIREKTI